MVIKVSDGHAFSKISRAIPIITALIIGLLFVFLTPSWWHHDEPGHFQVAWFYAAHDRFPELEEYDPVMRVDLARSLEEHGFYEYRNYKLDLENDPAPWVMSPQSADPKLSYFIYALPLRVTQHLDLATQLIILRLISLMYFIATVALIYQFAFELTAGNAKIAFLASFFFALLPGAVNQMTAVSNEPLGALLFTAFLFFAFRTLSGASSYQGPLPMLITGILAGFTITTIWISLVIVTIFTLLFKWIPPRWRKAVYIAPILLLAISPLFLLERSEARFFYRAHFSDMAVRQQVSDAPLGDLVLKVPLKSTVKQRIPNTMTQDLDGELLTLGFYAWADQSATYNTKGLVNVSYGSIPAKKIELTTKPRWVSFPIQMDPQVGNVQVHLINKAKDIGSATGFTYYQGISLAKGDRPDGPPQFTDETLSSGEWGNEPYTNLIRNPSLEERWFTFSTLFYDKAFEHLPLSISPAILPIIQDPWSTGWYFERTITSISDTYWGKIGASNFELLGSRFIYPLFQYLFIITGIFSLVAIAKTYLKKLSAIFFIFGWVLTIIWLQTLLRGAGTLETGKIVIPWARYGSSTFPLISIIIAIGTVWLTGIATKSRSKINALAFSLVISLPTGLAGISILSLVSRFWLTQYDPNKFLVLGVSATTILFLTLLFPPVYRFARKITAYAD